MKTPSSLMIAAFIAALPIGAAAERKPGVRCDTPFLEKIVKDFTGIGSVIDARIKPADIPGPNGEKYRQDVLRAGDAATCDAGTWWHLAPGATPAWRNSEAKKSWETGSAKQNAALLLVADGFFKSFDPKVAEALAAADEVIAAGIAIGVAEAADFPKEQIEFLKTNSGGALSISSPKSVVVIAPDKQKAGTVTPAQVDEIWRKLLDNKGATKAGGAAVLRFRQAILALGAEIGRQGSAESKIPGINAFTPGVPSGFTAANFDKAAAANDDKYRDGLAALAGKATVPPAALNDATPRAGALLDLVDLGLRNLVAIRAAQVADIVAAAKVKLGTRTIAAIVTSARAAETAKGATPLGGAAIMALSKTPEYMQLDALYDQSVAGKGLDDPATKAIAQAREDMKAAALSATLEPDASGRQAVVFNQGGRKTVLGSIVPPEEGATGDAARENAAAVVARFIVDGAKASDLYDTLRKAVLDPNNDPGKTMPSGVTSAEIPVTREVPPAIAKINADGAGCKNPNDIVRNNFESYAARKQADAAKVASKNALKRSEIEAQETKDKAVSAAECERLKAAATALQVDSFTNEKDLLKMRAKETADAVKWCAKDLSDIDEQAKKAQATLKADMETNGSRDSNKGIVQANADLQAAFDVAVTGSVSTLRSDYTNPAGGPRQNKLATDAGLNSLSMPRLRAFSKLWFMERWPEGEELSGADAKADERKKTLAASLAKCRVALGFVPMKDKDSKVSYSNPETPNTVAKKCGIQNDLKDWIEKLKGSVTE